MRITSIAAAAVCCILSAVPAFAGEIVQTVSYNSRLAPSYINPFDPSLGTLTFVDLAFSIGGTPNSYIATPSNDAVGPYTFTFQDTAGFEGFLSLQTTQTTSYSYDANPGIFYGPSSLQGNRDYSGDSVDRFIGTVPQLVIGYFMQDSVNASAAQGSVFLNALPPSFGSAGFGSATLTYYFDAAVPEPATWAMMVAGFGMIGFAARRRQPAKAAARFS